MTEFLYKDESYKIIGAMFEVYNQQGHGFLESVYQKCVELELGFQEMPYIAQSPLSLTSKDRPLKTKYVPDLIYYGNIIVELKACTSLEAIHRAQVFNYLKATGHRVGQLVNFGSHPKLEYERIVR